MDITPAEGQAVPAHPITCGHLDAYKHWLEGMHLKFPTFKHDHPPVVDVNKVADDQLTIGQKIADKVAATVGSWPFIITQSIILAVWLVLNSIAIVKYPMSKDKGLLRSRHCGTYPQGLALATS